MNMLGRYEEAEVTAARAAACKMGFITKASAAVSYEGETQSDGSKIMDAEPGSLEELQAGQDVKTIDWNHPNSSYQVFMKTALRGIAAGLGVSYNTLANDMESVNFASGKLGLDDERQMWKSIQYWFIESVLEDIFASWLEMALTTQAVPLPLGKFDKFNQPDFRGRNWGYVNPQQEVTADIARLNSGLTSRTRLLQERGIDREELDDEILQERVDAAAKGLVFSEVPVTPDSPDSVDGLAGDSDEPMNPEQLKIAMDTYGIGVRAGAITPTAEDEKFFRAQTGLPLLTSKAKEARKEDGGVRRPITLQVDGNSPTPLQTSNAPKEIEE
jgi:capsid protein